MMNRVIGLGLLVLVSINVAAQQAPDWEKTIRFDQLDKVVQDSLAHRKVNCLLRDRQGVTWFGTKKGLVYYNGHEVVAINDTTTSGEAINQMDVQTLMQTSDGDIWIGTKNEGAIRFREQDKTYQQYQLTTQDRQISSILSFCKGRQQEVWAGTFGGGVFRYDSQQDSFNPFQDSNDSTQFLSTSVVMDLHLDKHGILWGATFGTGLIRIDPHYQTVRQYTVNQDTNLPTNDLFSLAEGQEGTLWIGTYGKGLALYDRRSGSFSIPAPELNTQYIQSLHYERGYLWIATLKEGLLCYDTRRDELFTFSGNAGEQYTIAHSNVLQSIVDDYGMLWVITPEGISVAHADNILFSYLGSESRPQLNQPVTAIMVKGASDIWMGSADASLYEWKSDEKILVRHATDFLEKTPMSFTGTIITALGQDSQEGVWVGMSDGTLARWNSLQGEWKSYSLPKLSKNGTSQAVEAIYEDSTGVLWIGILERGLFYWDQKTDSIRPASQRWPSVGFSFTPKVFLDTDQSLWIGTLNMGIVQWNRTTGEVIRYYHQPNVSQGSLPSNQITGLAADSLGYLWIGTFDQGVCKMNMLTGTVEQITVQQGLLSNRITTLSTGKNRKVWIGSVQGISSYDYETAQISNYPSEEFLNGKELVHYSADSGKDIQLFGTLTGVVQVELHSKRAYQPAPLLVTNLISHDKNVRFSPDLPVGHQIDLAYHDNAFEISYGLQHFVFSKNHQYEYRLLGLEQDWKPVGNRTLASYTNLSPKSYEFEVRARSAQNSWTPLKTSITVTVHPAWYQTLLFRVILGASVLGLIGGIYYYRITLVQRRNRMLATLVAERTKELTAKNKYIEQQHHDIQLQNQKLEEAQSIIQQKNDDLQQMNGALEERVKQRTLELATTNQQLTKSNEELDLFVYRAYHDIIGPVARIEGLCQVAAMELTGQDLVHQYLEKLLNNCQAARITLQKVLQIHHVRHHTLQLSELNLSDYIQNTYSGVVDSEYNSGNPPSFSLHCDPEIYLNIDTELLSLVLTGFLQNAIQYSHYSPDSWIKVVVQTDGSDGVRISVQDNGEGILPSVRSKVFTMFFRGHETKSGTGLGLYIASLAAERMHGTVAYTEDQGYTEFTLVLNNYEGREQREEMKDRVVEVQS